MTQARLAAHWRKLNSHQRRTPATLTLDWLSKLQAPDLLTTPDQIRNQHMNPWRQVATTHSCPKVAINIQHVLTARGAGKCLLSGRPGENSSQRARRRALDSSPGGGGAAQNHRNVSAAAGTRYRHVIDLATFRRK